MDNLKRINFNVDEKMRKRFKIKLLKKGKTIREVLERFIKNWIELN